MDENNTCNFLKQSDKNHSFKSTHYCHSCSLRLCSHCVLIHNNNPNLFSHKVEKININFKSWTVKLTELEKINKITDVNDDNYHIKNCEGKLNQLNNIFRNMIQDFITKYKIFQDSKKKLENKIVNKENMNFKEENKNIIEKYKEIKIIRENIDDLYKSVENINTNGKLYIPKKINEKKNLCCNINNLTICRNINNQDDKIVINKESKNNNHIEKNDTKKTFCSTESEQNKQKKEQKKKSDIRIINTLLKEDQQYNNMNVNSYQLINNSEEKNNINKKVKREIKKRKCSFCEECLLNQNNSFDSLNKKINKKRKLENTNITKEYHDSIKSKCNCYTQASLENVNNSIMLMFNLTINEKKEISLSLLEINLNKVYCRMFGQNDIIHKKAFLHMEKFPFVFSRLINIKNKAFVIGGSSYSMDTTGNNLVFRLNYINENDSNTGKVSCIQLKDTLYRHNLHNLIYSKLYNSIFVLSGRDQTACEYATLDENYENIKEWKEFTHISNPRQNAISFLLNEKYIFLVGGQGLNLINYDVFDISSLFKQNNPQIWKSYNFIYDQTNKAIFEIDNVGIINYNNNIYILGGHKQEKYFNWKIYFTCDEDEQNSINYKKIEKIILFENQKLKNEEFLCFFGQQEFINHKNYFNNINFQGKYVFFPNNIFK